MRGQFRWRQMILALVAALLALVPTLTLSSAQQGFRLSIDADPTNGSAPCNPVDGERTVAVGSTYQVAVCLENQPDAPSGFQVQVLYDGNLSQAPEVPDVAPALDDNPDANAGGTTFGAQSLGANWDCTAFGVQMPVGNDPNTPDKADATIACLADILNPDTTLVSTGALAVITFNAVAGGDNVLTLSGYTAVTSSQTALDMGACQGEPTVPCVGATIHQQGAPGPTPTGGAIATPTGVAVSPTATPIGPTPQAGFETVALAAGCNPIASTWPDGTPVQTIVGAASPGGVVESLWRFDPAAVLWRGFSPAAPAGVSDLASVNQLDAVFVCVSAAGSLSRPAI